MADAKEPADPLAEYVKATGNSDAAIGRLINVNRWKISRGRRGDPPLPLEDQIALQPITGVSPAQWAEYYAKLIRERTEAPSGKPAKKGKPAQGRPLGASRAVEPEGAL